MDIRTSPLVEMAGEAKRPTRWWAAWLIAIVMIVVGLTLGAGLGGVVLGNPAEDAPLSQFVEFFMFATILVLLSAWLRFKERRPFSSVGLRGANPVGKLLLGLVIGAGMMTLGVVIPWALGQYEPGISVHGSEGISALLWLIPLLLVFIFQGSSEEILTRGYMLQVAGRQIPAAAAIIGTSLIFSAMHLAFSPIPFVNIVLYALFACFVALGQGSLWMICGIHAGWNYFQGNIYGLPVSGNPEPTALWDFGPAEGSSELITGGDFGVEASLIGTTILLVALAISFVYYRRQAALRAAAVAEATV